MNSRTELESQLEVCREDYQALLDALLVEVDLRTQAESLLARLTALYRAWESLLPRVGEAEIDQATTDEIIAAYDALYHELERVARQFEPIEDATPSKEFVAFPFVSTALFVLGLLCGVICGLTFWRAILAGGIAGMVGIVLVATFFYFRGGNR